MKKVFLSLFLGILLVGVVVASSRIVSYPDSAGGGNGEYYDYEYDLNLNEGWNLVSFGENFPWYMNEVYTGENLSIFQKVMNYNGPYGNSEKDSPMFVYVFDSVNKEYVEMYPDNWVENDEPGSLLYSSSMWIYVREATRIKYFAPNVPKISDTKLIQGWNFLAINPEMAGKSLNQIKGNCDIDRIYAYEDNDWVSLMSNLDDERMLGENSAQGHGIVVEVSSDCKLSSSGSSGVSVPSLPESRGIGFPDEIKGYELQDGVPEATLDCDDVRDSDDLPESLSHYIGTQLCGENIQLEYLNDENDGIFLNFMKITEGLDFYRDYLGSTGSSETVVVNGYSLNRLENHELYWWTDGYYDLILTQEYTKIVHENGWRPDYRKANGNNAPVKYFLGEHPPVSS